MRRSAIPGKLIEAGLSTAMNEVDCVNSHRHYFEKGWKFCPHCGVKIEIVLNCATCGQRFFSHKAFVYHAIVFKRHFEEKLPCPRCESPLRKLTKKLSHCEKCCIDVTNRGQIIEIVGKETGRTESRP